MSPSHLPDLPIFVKARGLRAAGRVEWGKQKKREGRILPSPSA